MKKLGLYVHIPFCVRKCNYCDFYSLCHKISLENDYIEALCTHIMAESHLYNGYEIDTVYLGGGTPSILSAESVKKLFECIKSNLILTNDAEITIEANPGTLEKEKLLAYREIGINRLSMGLQSTNDQMLKRLGRVHDCASFEESFSLARECGFDNISVDIMYGLPNQKTEDLIKTVDHVCDFSPEHISAYCLKIEDETPFGKEKESLVLPSDDEEYEMYITLCQNLEKRGYHQYEISNFAKEGYRSRHNMKYWLSHEYVGFGPSAHSYFDKTRYFYPRDIARYISQAKGQGVIHLTEEEEEADFKLSKMDEYVMLRLRLSDGVDDKEFRELFGKSFFDAYPVADRFLKGGYAVRENDSYRLTSKGFFVSNYICTELFVS